jgi:hypothetical protein
MAEKRVLLLLPELLCDQALWAHQSKYLSHLAEVIIADFTQSDSVAGMAEAALSRVHGNFALGGLSMGGYSRAIHTSLEEVREDIRDELSLAQIKRQVLRRSTFSGVNMLPLLDYQRE